MFRNMFKAGFYLFSLLTALGMGSLATQIKLPQHTAAPQQQHALAIYWEVTPTETIPPYTPLASPTLKPPPTFEPPTPTVEPSATPSITPTATIQVEVSIPGLNGAESPTPSTTPGCKPREDWKLTYTVQRDDALATIAEKYHTYVSDLVSGNCLVNKDLLSIGQVLRVPGDVQPVQGGVECKPYELLTPMNGTMMVPGDVEMTFNWIGPVAPLNLIRIYRPDGSVYEKLVELRQNEIINTSEFLRDSGVYTWYVYPLDKNYQQIGCQAGGPWSFSKGAAATYTPTMTPSPAASNGSTGNNGNVSVQPTASFNTDVITGVAPLAVNFINRSTGQLNGFVWDFGDNQASTASSPTHVYNAPGSYIVTLTAYGTTGSSTTTATIVVN